MGRVAIWVDSNSSHGRPVGRYALSCLGIIEMNSVTISLIGAVRCNPGPQGKAQRKTARPQSQWRHPQDRREAEQQEEECTTRFGITRMKQVPLILACCAAHAPWLCTCQSLCIFPVPTPTCFLGCFNPIYLGDSTVLALLCFAFMERIPGPAPGLESRSVHEPQG